ncbi:tetratricopeptide repeat protein [Endothiovibrio diazotrophicus]
MNIVEALSEAVDHHQHGRYPQAEHLYRAILAQQPAHPDANHHLGILALQVGKAELGLPHLKAAVEAAPHQRQFLLDYGEGLLAAGRPTEALQAMGRASAKKGGEAAKVKELSGRALVALFQSASVPQALEAAVGFSKRWPDDPVGWTVRFACHQRLGQFNEALQAAKKAVRFNPKSPDPYVNLGVSFKALGRLGEAETAYRQALAIKPDFAEAHNNLGNTLQGLGRLPEAEAAFRRALAVNPSYAEAHRNLGHALSAMGRLEAAAAAYREALAINRDDAEGQCHLGNALLEMGRPSEAEAAYRQALVLKPDYAEAYNRLGNALHDLGHLDDAEAARRSALAIQPDYAEAYNNLGNTLQNLRRLDEAKAAYRQALSLKPDYAVAHKNLGDTLHDLGALSEAEAARRRALEIKPDYAEAYSGLGNTLHALGRLDEAEAACRQALAIKPDHAEAYTYLGTTLNDLGRLDEAAAAYRQAVAIKPDDAWAHNNLGNVLRVLRRLDEAEAAYRQALAVDPGLLEAHSNLLFLLDGSNHLTPEARHAEALRYGATVKARATPYATWECAPEAERRLRVGLVSGDLRSHPVGHFLETVLGELSTEPFSLNAYLTRVCDDELSTRLRPHFTRWTNAMGLSDAALAQRIHDDVIDILVDLSGHTAGNRLPVFAWRPAPVQVSWLGYTATTGVAEIDYYLTDPVRVPPGHERWYSETVWRLPETRVCFSPPRTRQPVAPLPALENGYVTFGSFQNIAKLTDEALTAWGRILHRLPGARLRIQAKQLADVGMCQWLNERLRRHGIDPARVELHPPANREEYLKAHAAVDMILDTFPYPGGTTTCEALWMGVPTVTLAGDSETSRNGASQLRCAGLDDWVAESEEAYFEKAVTFAEDLEGLAALRSRLRERVAVSPLFDARRFARHFESALRTMWRRWCRQTAG